MTYKAELLKNNKINLLDLGKAELISFFSSINEKEFRAIQLLKWIHQLHVIDYAQMTNLSLKLRQYLYENTTIIFPEFITQQTSADGTKKWLCKLNDGNHIETVFIPEDDRGTLCISTQVGCPLKCDFCATGKKGFVRNLSTAEIIGQLWMAIHLLSGEKAITNVVIMGMGEPMLNYENVVKAVELMLDDNAYGLSKYRVTVSTAGIIPEMLRFKKENDAAFAVSLHAPNDTLRSKLMPINKKYPLQQLIAACKQYYDNPKRKITIEYIMLEKINDSIEHARQLVALLHRLPCKINLIPYNNIDGETKYRPSSTEQIDKFRQILLDTGFNAITRKTRGADIAASCGQLAGTLKAIRNSR